MSSTKLERIAKLEADMEKIKNRKSKLLQEHNAQQRKARVSRFCKRHGMIEKHLPELAALSDEQFEVFLNRTLLTGVAKKVISEIESLESKSTSPPAGNSLPVRGNSPVTPEQQKQHTQSEAVSAAKPAVAAQGGNNASHSKPQQPQTYPGGAHK